MKELFCEDSFNGFLTVNYSRKKGSIIDLVHGSKYMPAFTTIFHPAFTRRTVLLEVIILLPSLKLSYFRTHRLVCGKHFTDSRLHLGCLRKLTFHPRLPKTTLRT